MAAKRALDRLRDERLLGYIKAGYRAYHAKTSTGRAAIRVAAKPPPKRSYISGVRYYYYFKSIDLAHLDDKVIDALIACAKFPVRVIVKAYERAENCHRTAFFQKDVGPISY